MRWQDVTHRVTYKPGWTVELQRPLPEYERHNLHLMVTASWPNSCGDTPPTIKTACARTVPLQLWESMDDTAQLRWIYMAVEDLERHEQDEWFKVDGVCVHNPHLADGSFRA